MICCGIITSASSCEVHISVLTIRLPLQIWSGDSTDDVTTSCIHPLDPLSHDPFVLCNIYTGEDGGDKCNVNKAVEIGKSQMVSYQHALPGGFRDTIISNNNEESIQQRTYICPGHLLAKQWQNQDQ